MSYPDNECNLDNMMLYNLTLLCNIRSFNALIIIKLEYTIQALPDPDSILYKLPTKLKLNIPRYIINYPCIITFHYQILKNTCTMQYIEMLY